MDENEEGEEEAIHFGYNRTETPEEGIARLEELLSRSQARSILEKRIDGLERENKGLKRSFERESAWAFQLEGRVEELEHVLGVVHELAGELCGLFCSPKAEEIRDRLDEVLDVGDEQARCPTCRRTHADKD